MRKLIDLKVNEPEKREIDQDVHLNSFIDNYLQFPYEKEDRWDPKSVESKDVGPANKIFRKWISREK